MGWVVQRNNGGAGIRVTQASMGEPAQGLLDKVAAGRAQSLGQATEPGDPRLKVRCCLAARGGEDASVHRSSWE